MGRANKKERGEGPVNHRIWPGIEACPCGRVDRFSILNGKSQCSKRWLGVVFGLLLQKWYEITFAKIIYWNLNDEIHPFLVRKWQTGGKGDNQARESEIYFHFAFFLYFQILINNSLQNYSGRSWVVEVWVWMSPILAWIYRWALISLS